MSSLSRITDQHFATDLDLGDLLSPFDIKLQRSPAGYYRLWRSARPKDFGSLLRTDEDGFEANLDVQQFARDEITVKVSGGSKIVVEGRHEERRDEHGSVRRHFVRTYDLPHGCDVKEVACSLSVDGVLNVSAPRSRRTVGERAIPIRASGVPARPTDQAG